jgi:hypothetical protein
MVHAGRREGTAADDAASDTGPHGNGDHRCCIARLRVAYGPAKYARRHDDVEGSSDDLVFVPAPRVRVALGLGLCTVGLGLVLGNVLDRSIQGERRDQRRSPSGPSVYPP